MRKEEVQAPWCWVPATAPTSPPSFPYLQTVSNSPPRFMPSPRRMRHFAKPWYMLSQPLRPDAAAAARGDMRTWG